LTGLELILGGAAVLELIGKLQTKQLPGQSLAQQQAAAAAAAAQQAKQAQQGGQKPSGGAGGGLGGGGGGMPSLTGGNRSPDVDLSWLVDVRTPTKIDSGPGVDPADLVPPDITVTPAGGLDWSWLTGGAGDGGELPILEDGSYELDPADLVPPDITLDPGGGGGPDWSWLTGGAGDGGELPILEDGGGGGSDPYGGLGADLGADLGDVYGDPGNSDYWDFGEQGGDYW
jgi:hypothetical protein